MRLNIKATGIELTPDILSYAEKRLLKVEKYLEATDPLMAVELGRITEHHRQGAIYRAEVRISGAGTDFYASKDAFDLYEAIDLVKDEIIHEITKVKGKKRSLMKRGGRAVKDMAKGFPWVNFRRKN